MPRGVCFCHALSSQLQNEQRSPISSLDVVGRLTLQQKGHHLPNPLFSVVIPVFNGESFVADAIESVLAQEGASFQLIVVDDGSMDSTADILNRFGPILLVHRQVNRGPSAARNAGITYMRGEFALFLDADDLLPDGYLRRFELAAREAPEVEVFHCGWRGVTFDGRPLFEQEEPLRIDADPFHELPVLGMPHISSMVVRRSLVERIGGFDSGLPLQEDWDYALRLSASGARFRGVPGNVAIIRRHPDSLSAMRRPEMAAFGLAVLERHLRFHPHCSSCAKARVGLQMWQRAVLRADAQRLATRLRLTGRTARWIGLLFATMRHPRLVAAGLLEAIERLRRFAGSLNC